MPHDSDSQLPPAQQQGCPEQPDSLDRAPYNLLLSSNELNLLLRDQFSNLDFPKSTDLSSSVNLDISSDIDSHNLGYRHN